MIKKFTYQSKVFRDFEMLDKQNFHGIVRFYEENETAINTLTFKEYFTLQTNYAHALFEVGNYEKLLVISKRILEISIIHNIQYHEGEDIFLKTLYQKAQAHYHLLHTKEAVHVFKELIKMKPNDTRYKDFLTACYLRHRPEYIKNMMAIGILMYILSSAVVALDILVVSHFYNAYSSSMQMLWIVILVSGLVMLTAGFLVHRIDVYQRVKAFVKSIEIKKI